MAASARLSDISKIEYAPTYIRQRTMMEALAVQKLEQAVSAHGYRGASKCKHNGVVNIKPDDTQMIIALENFSSDHSNKEFQDALMKKTVANTEIFIIDVKVVAHLPNGDRAVGKLYKTADGTELILYLYGFSNYGGQLFKPSKVEVKF